ncbi:MAG: hypothetical protein ACYSWU_01825 [Planctomycetota bacterium]
MSDLQQRRAIIALTHRRGRNLVIDAQAPLANLFGYSNAMRGLSQGRAALPWGLPPTAPLRGKSSKASCNTSGQRSCQLTAAHPSARSVGC